jgi:hypothetical protein
VKLKRQFLEGNIFFLLFWLRGFPRFWGLDRFFGGLLAEPGTGNGKSNGDIWSFRPLGFTPAFGRVVAASRRRIMARLKSCP